MTSAGGIESKTSPNELHSNQVKEGDGKTWRQWAAEKAVAAEHVAAQGAVLVKDYAGPTAKYVADTATSIRHGRADPTKKDDVANGHNEISVQDVVDRYSTTARTPKGGQRSVTSAPTVKERTVIMAQSLKDSTTTALTAGEGDKELADSITASLSSLPTILREKMWMSSVSEDPTATGRFVADTVTASLNNLPKFLKDRMWMSSVSKDPAVTGPSVNEVVGDDATAPLERSLQDVKPESGESKSEASSATKVDTSTPSPR